MASIRAFFRRLLRFLGLAGPEHDAHAASAPATPVAPASAAHAAPPHPHPEVVVGGDRPGPTPAPTPAMPQLMALSGQYPSRGDGGTNAYFTQAMVQTFAGSSAAFGAPRAAGQTEQISNPPTNQALFSLLGTTFGGDGMRTFDLPNLNGRAAVGGQEVGMFGQGTLTLTWLISTGPSTLAPVPGTLAMFCSGWAPDGWAICDGSLLPISQYVPLFEAIGTAFGGDGRASFALPNLEGAAPIGVGQGPGRAAVAIGQQVAGPVPGLGLNYLISLEGPYPPSSGPGAFPDTGQFLGQVIAYAGGQAPAGWGLCNGALLPISANTELFQLIGITYGGDGQSNFALPDLRGLIVTGLPG